MKNRLLQEIKLHIVHAMVPAAILIAMLGWSLCAKGSQMASGGVLDKAIPPVGSAARPGEVEAAGGDTGRGAEEPERHHLSQGLPGEPV